MRIIMDEQFKKQSNNLRKARELEKNSDAIRIVREFQKKYRENIPAKENIYSRWRTNPSSVAEGTLRQKSYESGSLLT